MQLVYSKIFRVSPLGSLDRTATAQDNYMKGLIRQLDV